MQLGDSENVGDTPLYQRYGENVRDGLIPYADFYMEYPPAAVPVFVAPTLGERDDYTRNSKALQWLLGAASLVLVVLALGAAASRPRELYIAGLLVAVSPALLGRVTFARFDFWPAVLTATAVVLVTRGRNRLGAATLAAATSAKVYPVVLLPLFLVRAARSAGRRGAIEALAAYVAVLVAILAPLAVVGAGGLRFTLSVQLERPLQVESFGGSLLLALGQVGLYEPVVVASQSSHNLAGTLPAAIAALMSVVSLFALLMIWVSFRRSRRSLAELLTTVAAAVAVFVTFGRVLSPQYLIWLIPLVPLARGRRGLAAALLMLPALALTQVWAQGRYGDVIELEPIVWVVLARNLVLGAVVVLLISEVRATGRAGRRQTPRPEGDGTP